MRLRAAEGYLRQRGVTPLIRAARNQIEIDYLPPYGDPEVHIPSELTTYLLVTTFVVELLDRLDS